MLWGKKKNASKLSKLDCGRVVFIKSQSDTEQIYKKKKNNNSETQHVERASVAISGFAQGYPKHLQSRRYHLKTSYRHSSFKNWK